MQCANEIIENNEQSIMAIALYTVLYVCMYVRMCLSAIGLFFHGMKKKCHLRTQNEQRQKV